MSLNGLTGTAGLKLGPLVLETLVKHYFERLTAGQKIPATTSSDGIDGKQGGSALNLRQEELLYDQAFTIVKVSITRVLPPTWFPRSRLRNAECGMRGSCAPCPFVFGCALLYFPLLTRAILSAHHHVVMFRTSCRPLLGE